jgi:hypothetical protein
MICNKYSSQIFTSARPAHSADVVLLLRLENHRSNTSGRLHKVSSSALYKSSGCARPPPACPSPMPRTATHLAAAPLPPPGGSCDDGRRRLRRRGWVVALPPPSSYAHSLLPPSSSQQAVLVPQQLVPSQIEVCGDMRSFLGGWGCLGLG